MVTLSHIVGFRFVVEAGARPADVARAASRFFGVPCVAADVEVISVRDGFSTVDVVPMPGQSVDRNVGRWTREDRADGTLRVGLDTWAESWACEASKAS